jgi:hypothetical protein
LGNIRRLQPADRDEEYFRERLWLAEATIEELGGELESEREMARYCLGGLRAELAGVRAEADHWRRLVEFHGGRHERRDGRERCGTIELVAGRAPLLPRR